MSCDEKKVCCEQFEVAKTEMISAGFDPGHVADLIAQYGDSVVNLISDAIRNGFSRQFVIDTLVKFGPTVLQFLMSWFSNAKQKNLALGVAPTNVVEQTLLDASLIETFLQKMLPKLLDKYGEQLLDGLIKMVVNYLTK